MVPARGAAHSTHILKPRPPGRRDGLAREHYGHALAAELGLANYRTELVGSGARQYLVIERYDRAVRGEHAKNLAVLHVPGRSMLADVYDAVPNLFQEGRIDCNLALAIDGSFDHRRVSAAHLIREAERWNALGAGEAERIVTATLADFAKALNRVAVPPGVHAATAAQLAWNVERLQAGREIGERPTRYRRRPRRT